MRKVQVCGGKKAMFFSMRNFLKEALQEKK